MTDKDLKRFKQSMFAMIIFGAGWASGAIGMTSTSVPVGSTIYLTPSFVAALCLGLGIAGVIGWWKG